MFENRYKSYASKSTAYSISKKSELVSCLINYVFNSVFGEMCLMVHMQIQ